jgi:hypothetical protein
MEEMKKVRVKSLQELLATGWVFVDDNRLELPGSSMQNDVVVPGMSHLLGNWIVIQRYWDGWETQDSEWHIAEEMCSHWPNK